MHVQGYIAYCIFIMQKLRGPTTVMAKPKTWRQNRKPHGKTKDLMAKPNTSQQKPNTSRQKQIPTAKPKLFCSCSEVFGFATRYFVFAVRYFGFAVMLLSWGFWFCCDVFVFAMRFLVLPWQLWATVRNYRQGNYTD